MGYEKNPFIYQLINGHDQNPSSNSHKSSPQNNPIELPQNMGFSPSFSLPVPPNTMGFSNSFSNNGPVVNLAQIQPISNSNKRGSIFRLHLDPLNPGGPNITVIIVNVGTTLGTIAWNCTAAYPEIKMARPLLTKSPVPILATQLLHPNSALNNMPNFCKFWTIPWRDPRHHMQVHHFVSISIRMIFG